jgi:chorismate mutase
MVEGDRREPVAKELDQETMELFGEVFKSAMTLLVAENLGQTSDVSSEEITAFMQDIDQKNPEEKQKFLNKLKDVMLNLIKLYEERDTNTQDIANVKKLLQFFNAQEERDNLDKVLKKVRARIKEAKSIGDFAKSTFPSGTDDAFSGDESNVSEKVG